MRQVFAGDTDDLQLICIIKIENEGNDQDKYK